MAWSEAKHPRDSRGRFARVTHRSVKGAYDRGVRAAKIGFATGAAINVVNAVANDLPIKETVLTGGALNAAQFGAIGAAFGVVAGPKKTKLQKIEKKLAKAQKKAVKRKRRKGR